MDKVIITKEESIQLNTKLLNMPMNLQALMVVTIRVDTFIISCQDQVNV